MWTNLSENLVKYSLLFSLGTLVSRVLGLFRDALFSRYFGVSSEYDAYMTAILVPFFLRKIFAEGALSTAFIPLYSKKLLRSQKEAFDFASGVFTVFFVLTSILVVLAELSTPQLVWLFATGFHDERFEITVKLFRITFPFVIFINLWAIAYGILNSHSRFLTPAISPAISNLTVIFGTIVSPLITIPILGPAYGFTIGGMIQFLVLLYWLKKLGYSYRPRFKLVELKEFFKLFFYSSIGLSINQINSLIDLNLASRLPEGSVSVLQYANRLFQFPLGVFGIAVATTALPIFSRINDPETRKEEFLRSFRRLLYFVLPSLIVLLMFRKDIIALIFQGGKFTREDTFRTSKVLFFYLIGLPFYAYFSLCSRLHYSVKNHLAVTKATVWMVGMNITLNLLLYKRMGPAGLAFATSLAGITGVIRLNVSSFRRRLIGFKRDRELLKILVANIFSVFLSMILLNFLSGKLVLLNMLILGIFYITILKVFKNKENDEFLETFKGFMSSSTKQR